MWLIMTRVFCFNDVAISSMHEVNCQLPLMSVDIVAVCVCTGWQAARRHNRPNHMVTSHSHFRDEEKDPQTASAPLTQRRCDAEGTGGRCFPSQRRSAGKRTVHSTRKTASVRATPESHRRLLSVTVVGWSESDLGFGTWNECSR